MASSKRKYKFRLATWKNSFKYLARQSWSERCSMIVASVALLALAAPFCTFAQPDVNDKDGVMRQVVKVVVGWDLASVGGNRIGAWQWVDTNGKAHPTNPFLILPSPKPFSIWHAFLPMTTCLGMFAVILNLIMIGYLIHRGIENTDDFEDILIPALCTTACSLSVGTFQAILLVFGSMAGGGLLVFSYDWSGVEKVWDQAKKDGGAEVELGAALLVGWGSLVGCMLWIVIVKRRYGQTVAKFFDKRDQKRRGKGRVESEDVEKLGDQKTKGE